MNYFQKKENIKNENTMKAVFSHEMLIKGNILHIS